MSTDMEEYIKIGSLNAIKKIIYSIIKKRMVQLQQDLFTKIDSISDEQVLYEIALEVADANSINDFVNIINKSRNPLS